MKAKIEKIIKEIIRNEAISTDKLKMLAKKEGLNQKRITYVMRQAGVLKIMGQGVYQVLIRDKNTDDYILKATELMEADIEKRNQNKQKKKKDEPPDMSLPGKWENTKEQPAKEPYHEILDMPDVEAAEKDIDIHAKVLDMVNSFMEQVQTNTNKQNEYISELAARIDEMQRKAPHQRISELEKKGERHEAYIVKLSERIEENEQRVSYVYKMLEQSISALENQITERVENTEIDQKNLRDDLLSHQNSLQALQMITKGHKTEISNGGVLKALHQLLGEIV